jgi:hypothetical protein
MMFLMNLQWVELDMPIQCGYGFATLSFSTLDRQFLQLSFWFVLPIGSLVGMPGTRQFSMRNYFSLQSGYDGLYASWRTMDFYLFMNSKVLFKTVRKDANLSKLKPVIVHINYHPDKLPRMQAVVEFYVNGKQDALSSFPDGSE